MTGETLWTVAPRPLHAVGEGLEYFDPSPGDVMVLDRAGAPDAAALWRVGRRRARAGRFTPAAQCLPLYPRRPEALRLWRRRRGDAPEPAAPRDG